MRTVLQYLSFGGRANRQRYWLTNITLAVFMVIAFGLAFGLGAVVPALGILLAPIILALFYASFANGARRLHDRNKSAWWLLLFAGVPWFFSLVGVMAAAGSGDPDAANFIRLLGLPISLWAFVELGCLRGSTGPNKYGDDPLRPTAEVFA